MTFKDSFCPSPWFHMRITNVGHYKYCRWADNKNETVSPGIKDITPLHFFKNGMSSVRQSMLDGEKPPGCRECYQMEEHNKVSGRQKQLLKVGVRLDDFTNTMLSSPWIDEFKNVVTEQTPQDWQIDLGNFCNSACIFCEPASSSRLATEFRQLNIINDLPRASWCEDPDKFNSFLESIRASTNIKYIHFIGGETLITPAFKRILKTLIAENLHKTITIGFTTNLTVWDQEIVDLLVQFERPWNSSISPGASSVPANMPPSITEYAPAAIALEMSPE